ncbi:cobalamin biosynthesis protein [Shewanella sp. C32]|uniref:Cobalamin biosynthesis protein n=1 Tax=Shewanella electrica TaxID=515560 RepID=A0ABT2FFZ6_9GAMM|nr:cobalamin biosynthesis protein [Shewanella electrica]MCH1925392.1 cobalamin biosynthesis protein [Shewanella electrica]MCS4555217.1 cobalamin biosynthesis protein [Shewanella electrica]
MMLQQLVSQDGPLLLQFGIIALALSFALLVPLPQRFNPLYWFAELGGRMAQKVCRPNRSSRQQLVAGVMAILLLVMPFWLIVLFLLELAAYPSFFELAILYCCMRDLHARRDLTQVSRALLVADKPQARQLLSQWTSRDTEILSEAGIAKTAIELAVTSAAYGSIAVVLFYWIGGVPLVLLALMLKTLEQRWSPANPRYQHFSRGVMWLNHWLFWLPVQACRLSLAIQGGPAALKQWLRLPSFAMAQRGYLQICQLAATVLAIELGGARKYQGERMAVAKVGVPRLPHNSDIQRALSLANTSRWFWLGFSLIIPALWVLLRLR